MEIEHGILAGMQAIRIQHGIFTRMQPVGIYHGILSGFNIQQSKLSLQSMSILQAAHNQVYWSAKSSLLQRLTNLLQRIVKLCVHRTTSK